MNKTKPSPPHLFLFLFLSLSLTLLRVADSWRGWRGEPLSTARALLGAGRGNLRTAVAGPR